MMKLFILIIKSQKLIIKALSKWIFSNIYFFKENPFSYYLSIKNLSIEELNKLIIFTIYRRYQKKNLINSIKI